MRVALELASYLIEQQFGSLVKDAAFVLVGKGASTYEDFIRYAEEKQIAEEDAREGLSILLHHRIVKISLPDSEKDQQVDPLKLLTNKAFLLPQTEVKYSFDLDSILLRLRFPHFVHLAATELGKGESLVLQVVCLLGHCSLKEIESAFEEQHASENVYFHQYFTSLVQAKFIRKASPIPDRRVVLPTRLGVDLWELDVPSVLNKVRYEACVNMIQDKIDSTGGMIARSILILATGAASQMGLSPDQQFFSLDQILTTMEEHFPDILLDSSTLGKYLEVMCNDYEVSMVSKSINQPTYSINTNSILRVVRRKYIESTVTELLGTEALRIFRMLQQYKYMEEDQITQVALIDAEDVRRLLYKMMDYDLAQIQEVPRGSDYTPAKTFYLWHVDMVRVLASVEEIILRSILKMKQRLVSEKEKYKLLLEKSDAQADTGIVLTAVEKAQLAKFVRIENTLLANVHRVAGIFVVLHFYPQ